MYLICPAYSRYMYSTLYISKWCSYAIQFLCAHTDYSPVIVPTKRHNTTRGVSRLLWPIPIADCNWQPGVQRYKVCGDNESSRTCQSSDPSLTSLTLSWSILRPWSSVYGPSSGQRRQNRMSIAPSKNSQPGPSYETYFKCCIPFVSLTVDRAGKNIIVLSTDNNGYDKIPESSITVSSILSEVGRKVSIVTENLVLLDSKCYQLQMIKVNLFTLQVECVCTCVKCNIRWV